MTGTPAAGMSLPEEALEHIQNAFLVGDGAGRVVFASTSARVLFGGEVVGRTLLEILSDFAADTARDWALLIAAAPEAVPIRDGAGREFVVRFAPLTTGVVAELTDVSEVERLKRLRDAFLGFLNHDLRSPSISLIALLDLCEMAPEMMNGDFMARVRRSATLTLQAAENFMRLVHAGDWILAAGDRVLLSDAVQDAVDRAWDSANAIQVRIDFTHVMDEATIGGDHAWLSLMVTGVLQHAVADSIKPGVVSCELKYDASCMRLGFHYLRADPKKEDLSRLLSRAGPLAAVKSDKLPADMLPLALAKVIAEKHGGKVTAEYPKPGAVAFIFELPMG